MGGFTRIWLCLRQSFFDIKAQRPSNRKWVLVWLCVFVSILVSSRRRREKNPHKSAQSASSALPSCRFGHFYGEQKYGIISFGNAPCWVHHLGTNPGDLYPPAGNDIGLRNGSPARGVIWVANAKPPKFLESCRDEMWVSSGE